ncbi:1-acyl-sn-glycerol-3-phosphate acyltransferase [Pseudomonadaceae bacterium SI-3]|nr:1-acyl-sn-glycerol-3-phosphate acyltransferase [Pseudomonadaceae bacterium SI-3]
MRRIRLYFRLLRLSMVVLYGLLLACGLKLRTVLGFDPSQAERQQLCRSFLGRLAAALPFQIRVTGDLPDKPMLWVANHLSWTDIPLLGLLQPMTFLAKAEIRHWPVIGWLTTEAGTRFIQRGGSDSRLLSQQMSEELGQGSSLLIFPEGTTTDGTSLRTFHSRLLACAIDTGVPVQPVAIRYLRNGVIDPIAPFIGDDDLLSHLFRLLAEDTAVVEIQLLAPLSSHDTQRNPLARRCHNAIAEALYGPSQLMPIANAA